jgi:transposase
MAKRDLKALEQRRLRAARLLRQGVSQAQVARELEVSREAVRRWADKLEEGGAESLRRPARMGRPGGLDAAQKADLAQALKAGALEQRYATELWTVPRVTALIRERFGRAYSQVNVWRILRGMGWSPQRPERRARERNEAASPAGNARAGRL